MVVPAPKALGLISINPLLRMPLALSCSLPENNGLTEIYKPMGTWMPIGIYPAYGAYLQDSVFGKVTGQFETGYESWIAETAVTILALQKPFTKLRHSRKFSRPSFAAPVSVVDEEPSTPIHIEHHKTGSVILLPLDRLDDDGTVDDCFYPEAETILQQSPARHPDCLARRLHSLTA